ncbi:MAG: HAD-IC family P-type ATPase, partial [Gammaproteobacteria bacterium]|nr:HAD-IC family P-type ATPase [Gammaproteobacteria bacterium]
MTAGPFHAETADQVAKRLDSDLVTGLSAAEAQKRLADLGPNALKRLGARSWQKVLLAQFFDLLILILLFAALISLLLGHPGDAITIIAVVLLNGCLGFVQEWRAEKSLEALQSMLAQKCQVIRDGKEQFIDATLLVPGDLVSLKIGDLIPADIRLINVMNLRADESALTGESAAIRKTTEVQAVDADIASRFNMVWMGSAVVNGYGRGLVVSTAMKTEFGRIAELTQSVGKGLTPLQKRLGNLGKNLGLLSIGLSFAVALLGWLLGRPLVEMFFTGVALAVAIVPEALPIVVTTTLALGIRSMVKKQALFRHLQSAETLGSATVICSDKTGTITSNEMTVTDIWLPSGEVSVTGEGYVPVGDFEMAGERIDYRNHQDLIALLNTALICNHAELNEKDGVWQHVGEPTEAALVTAACKCGLVPPALSHVTELSFNSERKRMSVVMHDDADATADDVAHVKGAPEVILERCNRIRVGDDIVELDDATRSDAEEAYRKMAARGLRVLALAT